MKLFCTVFILIASYTAYSMSDYQLSNYDAQTMDGKIQASFSLNQEVNSSIIYTVYISCFENENMTKDGNEGMGGTLPQNDTIPETEDGCESLNDEMGLEFCCTNKDNCVNGRDFEISLGNSPTAGIEYVCNIAFSDASLDGPSVETDPFTAETGIPSRPYIDVAERSNETSLPIGITVEHDGVDDSSSDKKLVFRVIIRDEDGKVVRNVTQTNTTSQAVFKVDIDDLENGEYTITASVSNIYGTSTEAEEVTVTINRVPIISTTPSPSTESTRPPKDDTGGLSSGAIAGVVVAVVVGVLLVVGVAVAVSAFMYYKKHNTGVMKVKVAPVE